MVNNQPVDWIMTVIWINLSYILPIINIHSGDFFSYMYRARLVLHYRHSHKGIKMNIKIGLCVSYFLCKTRRVIDLLINSLFLNKDHSCPVYWRGCFFIILLKIEFKRKCEASWSRLGGPLSRQLITTR